MKQGISHGFKRNLKNAISVALLLTFIITPFSPVTALLVEASGTPCPEGKECAVFTKTPYSVLDPGYGIGVRSVGATANQICKEQGYEGFIDQPGYWTKAERGSPSDNYQRDYVNGRWEVRLASGGNDEYWTKITCQRTAQQNEPEPSEPSDNSPIGHLDSASCSSISGWAYDPDEPSAQVSIHLYDGPAGEGTLIAAIQANQPRSDVNSVTGVSGDHGFSFSTPESLKDGNTHVIYAYGINTDSEGENSHLSSSPKSFSCATQPQEPQEPQEPEEPAEEDPLSSHFMNVAPSSPVVSGPVAGGTGAMHTFTAVSNDPNSDDINYGFDWDNDGTVDEYTGYTASGATASLARSWANAGTYTFRVIARDGLSAVSAATTHTIVISSEPEETVNTAPNAPLIQGPEEGLEDISHSFTVTATDPQGDQVQYGFDWDNDGTIDGSWTSLVASGISASRSKTWNSPGIYTFGVAARDSSGLISPFSTHTITVTEEDDGPAPEINAAPSKPVVSGPSTGGINADYAFSAVSTDPNSDDINYGFDWDNDGTVDEYTGYTASGATASLARSWANAGTYTFRVIARDGLSAVSAATTHTIVISSGQGTTTNSAPNEPLVQGPENGVVGASYSFTVTATDPQGSDISYGFDWQNDGIFDVWTEAVASGMSASRSNSWSSAGAYTFGVVARDVQNATSSVATHTIVISGGGGGGGNLAPSIPAIDGPATGTTSISYTFTANATDPEGSRVRYGFDWQSDGIIDDWTALVNSGEPAGIPHIFGTIGTYTVSVYAEDENGARSEAATKQIQIAETNTSGGGNNSPVVNSISGTTTGAINTSYSFTATASDPDGDIVQYAFDWDNNGIIASTTDEAWSALVPSGTPSARSMSWPSGGSRTFQVFARDANGAMSAGLSHTIVIAGTSTVGFAYSIPANSFTSEAGATAAFTVVLTSAPLADVTIPVMSSDLSEATTSESVLIFTPSNWNVSQTVTVTGVDDSEDDGDVAYTIVLGPTTSSDLAFNALPSQSIPLVNLDNDTAPGDGDNNGSGGGSGSSGRSRGGSGRSGGPCIGYGCPTTTTGVPDDIWILIDNPVPTTPVAPVVSSVPSVERVCRYSDFITTFLKKDTENDPNEVRKLQYYLNTYENAGLDVDGFFGTSTEEAVMAYQAKYAQEILAPWGTNTPTGIVYITTTAHINKVFCTDNPEYRGNEDIKDILDGVLYPPIDNSGDFEGDIGSNATNTNVASVFGAITQDILNVLKDIPWYPLLIVVLIVLGTAFIGQALTNKNMQPFESKEMLTRGAAVVLTGTVLNVLNTVSFMIKPEWLENTLNIDGQWALGLNLVNLIAVAVICVIYLVSNREQANK